MDGAPQAGDIHRGIGRRTGAEAGRVQPVIRHHQRIGAFMVAVAAFSHANPFGEPLDANEDLLHSITASGMVFAFAWASLRGRSITAGACRRHRSGCLVDRDPLEHAASQPQVGSADRRLGPKVSVHAAARSATLGL